MTLTRAHRIAGLMMFLPLGIALAIVPAFFAQITRAPVVERRSTWCPTPEDREEFMKIADNLTDDLIEPIHRARVDDPERRGPTLTDAQVLARLRAILAPLTAMDDSPYYDPDEDPRRIHEIRGLIFELICDYDLARSPSR